MTCSLVVAAIGLGTACAESGVTKDPLGADPKPAAREAVMATAARRQLQLQAVADGVEARFVKLHANEGF